MSIFPLDSTDYEFFKGKCYGLAILLTILTLILVQSEHLSEENGKWLVQKYTIKVWTASGLVSMSTYF